MNDKTMTGSCALATALALVLLPAMPVRGEEPEEPARGIGVDSYAIVVEELAKPVIRVDDKGIEKSYDRVWVVTLEGDFGEARATPLDVFIGDYNIPEYGATEDGIYFKIYDEGRLDELEGQPFGFGLMGEKLETSDVLFTPGQLRPFERRREPPADDE